jgi:hypothetical protein
MTRPGAPGVPVPGVPGVVTPPMALPPVPPVATPPPPPVAVTPPACGCAAASRGAPCVRVKKHRARSKQAGIASVKKRGWRARTLLRRRLRRHGARVAVQLRGGGEHGRHHRRVWRAHQQRAIGNKNVQQGARISAPLSWRARGCMAPLPPRAPRVQAPRARCTAGGWPGHAPLNALMKGCADASSGKMP